MAKIVPEDGSEPEPSVPWWRRWFGFGFGFGSQQVVPHDENQDEPLDLKAVVEGRIKALAEDAIKRFYLENKDPACRKALGALKVRTPEAILWSLGESNPGKDVSHPVPTVCAMPGSGQRIRVTYTNGPGVVDPGDRPFPLTRFDQLRIDRTYNFCLYVMRPHTLAGVTYGLVVAPVRNRLEIGVKHRLIVPKKGHVVAAGELTLSEPDGVLFNLNSSYFRWGDEETPVPAARAWLGDGVDKAVKAVAAGAYRALLELLVEDLLSRIRPTRTVHTVDGGFHEHYETAACPSIEEMEAVNARAEALQLEYGCIRTDPPVLKPSGYCDGRAELEAVVSAQLVQYGLV